MTAINKRAGHRPEWLKIRVPGNLDQLPVSRLMNDLARQGAVILMVSSELPELLGMSDRVLVLHKGRLSADLPRREATQERVLHFAMTGRDIAGDTAA